MNTFDQNKLVKSSYVIPKLRQDKTCLTITIIDSRLTLPLVAKYMLPHKMTP